MVTHDFGDALNMEGGHLQRSQKPSGVWVRFIRLAERDIALFRFLLEAYDHVGYFTVLEHKTALLKFVCPSDMKACAARTLEEISLNLPLTILCPPWERDDSAL